MRGLAWDDPYRIRTWKKLVNWVNEIGFLPLFSNDIMGFLAEGFGVYIMFPHKS